MPSGGGDVARLHAAIEAYERFVTERGSRNAGQFLAEHEEFRDLLEPLIAQSRPQPQPHATSDRVLGDFRLLNELGRGGMGIVYDAEQISLGRRVAVKVLPGRLALDPARRARFEREARLAASLDHPGIAKVISADTDGDVVWFAMERIDGAPLDRVLRRTTDTKLTCMTGGLLESVVDEVSRQHGVDGARIEAPAESSDSTVWRTGYVDTVVRIGAQIAEALQHAHQHGVIHRDVKPGNVLLRRDGSAVLTDFGLARELHAPSQSLTGEFLGTPSYCAPEQLSGDHKLVDHRTDVFALGVTLYELLTHHRPFEASSADEVRIRILSVEPQRPRRLNSKISTDLSSVLLKALEKAPRQRYQSAAAMAADLRAVAAGRPVEAVSVRVHKRALRWCKRNQWATTALVALLLVVALLLTVSRQLLHANAGQLEKRLRAGVALTRAGDFHGALAGLMPLEQELAGAATQAALDEFFRRFPCLASYPLTTEPGERVTWAQFSSDGDWVLTLHQLPNKPEVERFHLKLHRVPSLSASKQEPGWGEQWKSQPCLGRYLGVTAVERHMISGQTVVWIKDKRTVAIGGPDRETLDLHFINPLESLVQSSVPGSFGVRSNEELQLFDGDGQVVREISLPMASSDARLVILDDVLVLISRHPGILPSYFASASSWSVPIELGDGPPQVTFDPDDPTRMIVTTETLLTVLDAAAGGLEVVAQEENVLPRSVQYSHSDDEKIDSLHDDPRWAPLGESLSWRARLITARYCVVDAGESTEPRIVAIEDQGLRIWGLPSPQMVDVKDAQGGRARLEIARFQPGTRLLWCAGLEALVRFGYETGRASSWADVNVPDEVQDAREDGLNPSICGIAFGPDGVIYACAREDVVADRIGGWLFAWPPSQPQRASAIRCVTEPGWVEFSLARRQLAVALRNGGVALWTAESQPYELTDKVVLPALEAGAMRLSCVRFLGDRFLLASACESSARGGLLCWDLEDRESPPALVSPAGVRGGMRCLVVSGDNELVATGGDDRLVRVMRVISKAGRLQLVPIWTKEHQTTVLAVDFVERDGALLLASADRHGGIRLWNAETGDEQGIVRDASGDETQMILSLEFSVDGRYLAAAQICGRVLLWDLERARTCLDGNRNYALHLHRLNAETR